MFFSGKKDLVVKSRLLFPVLVETGVRLAPHRVMGTGRRRYGLRNAGSE